MARALRWERLEQVTIIENRRAIVLSVPGRSEAGRGCEGLVGGGCLSMAPDGLLDEGRRTKHEDTDV